MIRLSNISLRFPDGDNTVTAVDDVSLELARGTVAGITGPSGSGKSSLLAVAATLIPATIGTVEINGRNTAGMTARERSALRRNELGIVFQQSNLIPSLTALEQLIVMTRLGKSAKHPSAAASRARALDLLDQVGLAGQSHKRPAQLSGGERQRVNIARALMNAPAILIVDEPTSALDSQRGAQILDLIMKLSAEHETATMIVTHDLAVLARADQQYSMLDGALTAGIPVRPAAGIRELTPETE